MNAVRWWVVIRHEEDGTEYVIGPFRAEQKAEALADMYDNSHVAPVLPPDFDNEGEG